MEKVTNQSMKVTSIGLIPEDWDAKSLSQIGVFSKGKGVTRANAQSGDIPCVRYGEIYTSHNDYIRAFYSHISPEIAATATKLKKDDILFAGSGETKEEIGKAVAFLGDEEAYAGGDIIILSPKEKSSSKYLGYVLNAASAVNQKASMGQGDAVVHIHAKELGDVVIPFPNLDEQNKIADALSGVDDMIEALNEAIAKKQQIKEGLMQQLLTGKTRLPGFDGAWKEVRLGDIFDFYKGSGLSKVDLETTGLNRCVLYGEIFTRFDIEVRGEISRTNSPIGTLSVKGDVLMPGSTTTTGIDLVKAVYINEDDVQLGGDIIILRKKQTIDSAFFAMLISNVSRNVVAEKTQGTTIIHLHGKSLIDIRYFVPESEKEQKAISSIVLRADADIEELSKKKDKLLLIKQGMMQELLTGKTRLI